MAIASLTRMTVPLASDQSATSQGLLMPKLKFRFRVTFEGFGVSSNVTELTKQVIDATKPNANFNPITIDVYNSKVYLQGKPEWQELTINIRDDAVGNISKLIGEQIQKQFDFAEQSSAASGIDYKFVTRLEILDGGNGSHDVTVLETWEMYGCQLASVNWNELSYSSNDPQSVTLSIRFDNALQTPDSTGVGTNVGRTIGTNVS